jgi:L,D-transpeptidase ErfK/SrfK
MLGRTAAIALCLLCATLTAGAAPVAPVKDGEVIGRVEVYVARYEDTIPRLAQRFGLGFVEVMAANPGIDPWLPGEGREVLLPSAHVLPDTPREGIVINLADLRLYHFRKDGRVTSVPVGIGRDYWQTPAIESSITLKRRNPTWTPPASIRAEKPDLPAQIGPGPDNPLGDFAMNLGYGSYVIHGTNKPLGVGRRVSHGCIRLYPEDIAALFEEVDTGTPVRIVDQEIKLGWSGGDLYLEAHPGQKQADSIEAGRSLLFSVDMPGMMARLADTPGAADVELDYDLIERTLRERRGIPVRISLRSSRVQTLPLTDHLRRDSR